MRCLKFFIGVAALCSLQCGNSEDVAVEVRCMPCDPVVIEAPMTIKRGGKDITATPPWVQWRYGILNHTDRDVVIVSMSVVTTESGAGRGASSKKTTAIDPNSQLATRTGTSCASDDDEGSGNTNGESREVLAVVGPNLALLDPGRSQALCDGEFIEDQPYFLSGIGSKADDNARPDTRRVFFAEGFLIGWYEGPARDADWRPGQYEACEDMPYNIDNNTCNTPGLVNGLLGGDPRANDHNRIIPTRRMTARFRFSTQ